MQKGNNGKGYNRILKNCGNKEEKGTEEVFEVIMIDNF